MQYTDFVLNPTTDGGGGGSPPPPTTNPYIVQKVDTPGLS